MYMSSLYIFVHVDMYSDDDFSVKNDCLSNISNINFMKLIIFIYPIFLRFSFIFIFHYHTCSYTYILFIFDIIIINV